MANDKSLSEPTQAFSLTNPHS